MRWDKIFSKEQLNEGEQFFAQGKAKKLTEEDDGFSCVVRDDRNYQVHIYDNEDVILQMECSCAKKMGQKVCSHMVAALLLV